MTSRVPVAICGAVALVVLARAGAYYARVDALALGLVLAMTVALVGSIAELLTRVGRAERLTRELGALPRPATQAAVDGASGALRPILIARIANAPAAAAGAPLAGYVVGLLVMLGLLGTFLGLFETLRGAREALTGSGDVETLRASLGAPMQGLTRSFGTSAAGVSASAMLGLAAAVARGAEARLAQALSAYAAGALLPLTVQGRQLVALERLAAHGDALPRAVVALDAAAERLGALQASWAESHGKAAERTAGAIRELLEGVKGEVGRAAVSSAAAAGEALAPLVTRVVEGSIAAAKDHLAGVETKLAADLEARRTADVASARARDEALGRLATAEDGRAEALAARWAEATRTLETTLDAIEARAEARDATFARAAREIAEAAGGTIDVARARLAEAGERAAGQSAEVGALVAGLEAQRLAMNAAVGEQRAAMAAAVKEQREAVQTLLGGVSARTEALLGGVAARTEALLGGVATRTEALFVGVAERADAFDAQARAGHAALVGEVQRGVGEHASVAAALEREVATALAAQAERVLTAVGTQAEEVEARFEALAAAVREAAAGVQAGGGELAAVAEMFAGAVDRHREGAAAWLAGLGTIEGAIARAADGSAGGAVAEQLDRARELYDAQLQFHRELLLQLRGVQLATQPRREAREEDAPA